MSEALLSIYFLMFGDRSDCLFDEIIIDNTIRIKTGKDIIDIKIEFNKYEKDLGRKVCFYTLKREIDENEKNKNNDEDDLYGSFEIYFGKNIGYCFIDDIGETFELLFLKKKENLQKFIENKISLKNKKHTKKIIDINPNKIDTEDRANILLINCPLYTSIKIDEKQTIDLKQMDNEINVFSGKNDCFQICFHTDNIKDYSFRKIRKIEEFNFDNAYNKYNLKVNQIYNNLLNEMNNDNSNVEDAFFKLLDVDDLKLTLEKLIDKKLNYGRDILEEELNKEFYIDFIFKIVFFKYIDYIIDEKLPINYVKLLHDRLVENKIKICGDKSLKIYEKIFLIIELFSTKIILEDDYIINYLNLNNIEDFSPMYYAKKFFKDFVRDLDYKSDFYYPLLSIDADRFYCKIKEDVDTKLISTFGFNMISLDKIKSHLNTMIPNVIILLERIKKNNIYTDDESCTNFLTGSIMLNISKFEKIKIDKNELNVNDSKHYGFLISKSLIHEIFGHKKSSFSQLDANNDSIMSFKDKCGNLKFLSDEEDYLFKNKDEIFFGDINQIKGESGYFLEYYMGKIEDKYTTFIIDEIKNKTRLGILLDTKLWHKELQTLIEYVKLKYLIIIGYKEDNINNELDIHQQINKMKEFIKDYEMKFDKSSISVSNEKELDDKINEKFKDLQLKKRKAKIISDNNNKQDKNKKIKKGNEKLNLREHLRKYGYLKK